MDRNHAIDIALLICVVGLAVATWAAMSGAGDIITWRPCFGISATIFLALAALTPYTPWAMAVRLVMSLWLMMAPWLLAFADVPLARWSHVITASLIALSSMPRLVLSANHNAGRT